MDLYLSTKGDVAVKTTGAYDASLYRLLKSISGFPPRFFDAKGSCIYYLNKSAKSKVDELVNELKRVTSTLNVDKNLFAYSQQQVQQIKAREFKQQQSTQSQQPIKEQSVYQYVKENHVPLPKEKSLSQRQLQCMIRQHPDEALDFILNAEDEKHLDYIVFGDWHVDEVQVFDRNGWELCMRGYGLELPNIKDDRKFMIHCLPILYKKAREYEKQNTFNIFVNNLKSVLAE